MLTSEHHSGSVSVTAYGAVLVGRGLEFISQEKHVVRRIEISIEVPRCWSVPLIALMTLESV